MGGHTGVEAGPKPIEAGPEVEALRRFCPTRSPGMVTIHGGGMGPGTPAMTGIGRGTHQAIQDGRWIVGGLRAGPIPGGRHVHPQMAAALGGGMVPEHGQYRAVMADNYGNADVYRGRIDCDRLIFEPVSETILASGSPGT